MDIQQALTDAAEAAISAIPVTPVAEATPAPKAKAKVTPQESAEPQDETPTTATDEATDEATEVDTEVDTGDASDEATDATAEDAEEAEAAPELPDGYVAVPVVADKLATEFVLRDAEGEVEVPNLIVEYKANGKVRQDRLDQVVKLAQWGVYNEERERKAQELERQAVSITAEREQLTKLLDEREAQMERLLSDEEFLLSVREAYAQENSPEKRAQRAEQEVQQMRVQSQMTQIAQQGQQFYEGEVVPAIKMIADALPTIKPDELEERMAYAMQLHAAVAPNGQTYLPASRFEAARQYIVNDLALWAQMTHARRSEPATSPEITEARAAVSKAQVEAQKAKRAVGQATKPVGRAASNTPAKPKAPKPSTVDDALDSAMSEILSSIR